MADLARVYKGQPAVAGPARRTDEPSTDDLSAVAGKKAKTVKQRKIISQSIIQEPKIIKQSTFKEPTDEQFFDLNPMAVWKRADALRHGFDSVRQTLSDHSDVLRPLFESYGLDFRPPDARPEPASPPNAPEVPEESLPLRLVGTRAN